MRFSRRVVLSIVAAVAAGWLPELAATQLDSWVLPEIPTRVTTGGEVVLELNVSASGSIAQVRMLRSTPPFSTAVTDAVQRWRFTPATESAGGTQLVVAVFTPPTLRGFGGPGTPPRDVGRPSAGVARPRTLTPPTFPAGAQFGGVVLVAAEVTESGNTASARVLSPGSGLDSAALAAVKQWTFEPAVRDGAPRSSTVYALVGFAQPVLAPQSGVQ